MPLIIKWTRITRSTATLTDNIFANNFQEKEHFNGAILSYISDHLPIFSITNFGTLNQSKTYESDSTTRIITKSSLESFANKLQTVDWQQMLSLNDPAESFKTFWEVFFMLYTIITFQLTVQEKNKSKLNNWITKGLKKSTSTKERLYKRFLNGPTA